MLRRNAVMQATNIHISDLLYEHDCLIIPNLGAFVASRVAATIDTKRGIMLPPRKEIVFNRNLQHNDGMLVSYVARQHGISLDEANLMVSEYAELLNKQLRQTGTAHIDGIGVLKTMGNGVMLLQDKNSSFLAESYGLSQQMINITSSGSSLSAAMFGNVRKVAASVAVLIGLLMIAPETRDTSVQGQYAQASVVANLFSNASVNNETENSSVVIDEIEKTQVLPADVYYIIVASFPTEREADIYITTMKNQGIDGLEKIISGKRVRVSAGEFADHDTAVRNNGTFRSIAGFENAWVLKDKK